MLIRIFIRMIKICNIGQQTLHCSKVSLHGSVVGLHLSGSDPPLLHDEFPPCCGPDPFPAFTLMWIRIRSPYNDSDPDPDPHRDVLATFELRTIIQRAYAHKLSQG
jgi:hypothetical protein